MSTRVPAIATMLLAAALTTGCIGLPPAVPQPTDPQPTTEPAPTEPTVPAPLPTTEPDPQPTQLPGGELPSELSLTQQMPTGWVAGWSTSLIGDSRFEPMDDNDFPEGPTLSVYDAQTECGIWAYTSVYDAGSDDLLATVDLLEGITSQQEDVSSWTTSTTTFATNAQGVDVEFGMSEGGDQIWAGRVYGSIAAAQSLQVRCVGETSPRNVFDEVIEGLLLPDFIQG